MSLRRPLLPERDLDNSTVELDPAEPPLAVRVRDLTKAFRRADASVVPANDHIDLDVHAGEFVVLLGPSGCGKTTLLRSIAGLEKPDSGTIEVLGRTMYSSSLGVNVPPEKRKMSMIFQSYALWPHMTTFDNVAYPLRARHEPRSSIAERVTRALQQVGIAELRGQFPGQMSGGQQQRVAVARAIVSNDAVVLFDEPLSNVDAKVREQVRLELLMMQQDLGFAALHVTHDQTEAMELASRIAVMRDGRIEQLGSPREIYLRPLSRYVANFVGRANELVGTLRSSASGEHVVETAVGTLVAGSVAPGLLNGDDVVVLCRPEGCDLTSAPVGGANGVRGVVVTSLFVGAHVEYLVRVGESSFKVAQPDIDDHLPGDEVWVTVPRQSLRVLPADDPAASE